MEDPDGNHRRKSRDSGSGRKIRGIRNSYRLRTAEKKKLADVFFFLVVCYKNNISDGDEKEQI